MYIQQNFWFIKNFFTKIESPYLSSLDFWGVVRFAIAEVTKEGNPFVLWTTYLDLWVDVAILVRFQAWFQMTTMVLSWFFISFFHVLKQSMSWLERTYKPHYHYQNFSPLANGTDLNREKYAILQTHWH